MMHSEPTTRSPSSFSFTRSTPCVDGCCGPILRMISSAPSTVALTPSPNFDRSSVRVSLIVRISGALLAALNPQGFPHPVRILLQNVVLLPQRIALPLVRQQDALQIRMPLEDDPEHVVAFALEPVCHGPNFAHARHRLVLAGVSLQPQPFILGK